MTDDIYLFKTPAPPAAQAASVDADTYNAALSQENGNLYADGGFESGTLTGKNGYWTDAGSFFDNIIVNKADDADSVYEGNYGLKFASTGDWQGRAQFQATLKPNTTYRASFMYKVDLDGEPNAPVIGFEKTSHADPYTADWATVPNYKGQAEWITGRGDRRLLVQPLGRPGGRRQMARIRHYLQHQGQHRFRPAADEFRRYLDHLP